MDSVGHFVHPVSSGLYASSAFLQAPCVTVRDMAIDADLRKTIGARMRKLREDAGLTLADVAEAIDATDPSRIGHYEKGRREPTLAIAVRIATALKTSPAHLLCLDNGNPVLGADEKAVIDALRAMPAEMRDDMVRRIRSLALIHAPIGPADQAADVIASAANVSRTFVQKKKKGASRANARGASRVARDGGD